MENYVDVAIDWGIRIGLSILIFVIAKIVGNIIYNTIIRLSEKTKKIKFQYKKTMKTLINLAMYIIAAFIIISVLFKNLGPMVAGLGVSGIVIGLAVKEPLGNLIDGILIMMNKLVVEGEAVEINNYSGSIIEINLNHLKLKTWDGQMIDIPNTVVWNSSIIHYWPEDIRRNEISVGISYDDDIPKAMELLNEIINNFEMKYIDDDHQPAVLFQKYGSSSIDFIVRYWVKRPDFFSSKNELAKIIKKEFDEKGLTIPFTQIDLHMMNQ
ncbi:mechanosensitive ion channel family protein [Geotoga petraea]|uniref:Mechanosensitive ion channel family protein n=1 Tax=Geotoga petraea TaxID=28234 RepID=A0A1G6PVP9_9BACT|nr:mechanosensitive ion channel family protein [Geotoga petraea]TGG86873.1 mechanosensitive ion channel family protein [Geotoga petraea]SDC83467.1 small conductance mechanosensitive channel [Geotoga petraea]